MSEKCSDRIGSPGCVQAAAARGRLPQRMPFSLRMRARCSFGSQDVTMAGVGVAPGQIGVRALFFCARRLMSAPL
ncbi:hypothetical protein M878_05425 [Streptomyces roseochromogenus subsp. oscitans DS 12.976]|uniref:Uncharacterized protein n=1 Tax=Streptomyces roseochromogenus subsp. oscitans DS 12.976 TaxID=1352936 RepID=V6KVN3_STRRC|nr:hypothetical protein M878_05425 [Streptomyces roseochromogenus subsp. oscitans DS 12.976]